MWKNFDYQEDAQGVIFRGKRADEEIVLFLRRHWLILVFKLIPAVVFLAVLLFILFSKEQMLVFFGWPSEVFNLVFASLLMFFWINCVRKRKLLKKKLVTSL